MKKIILSLIVLLFMSVNSFALSGLYGILTPENKTEKVLYIAGSLILIGAGVRVMEVGKSDLTTSLVGAGIIFSDSNIIYMTIFEW